ncbi:MAG: hypothetical protein JWR01_135 [Subtercola sp.]|nr:hypothetical protein [Subtercola sp.]
MFLRVLASILKPLLLAPPLARAGYLYATLVGVVWGSVLSTGRIRRVNGLFVFTGVPTWAFSRGGSCIGGVYLTDQNAGERVLEHEQVHRQQWKKYGLTFPIVYFLAGTDPVRNRFEIEAGLEAGGYR